MNKFEIQPKKGRNKNLYSNKRWLYQQYIIQQKCPKEIAEEFELNMKTISIWLKKFDLLRTPSEARKISIRKKRHKGFEKGNIPWNKNIECDYCKGEKHYNWKGNDATYKVNHLYAQKYKEKPLLCERCKKKKKLELSFDHNLRKSTKNFDDYEYLCHSCHMKRDRNEFNIMNNQFTKDEYF